MKKLIPLFVVMALAACHDVDKAVVKGKVKDLWPQVSDSEFLRTRGVGVPPENARGLTRRRGLSRNAALVSARYEMLAVLKGVKVGGGLTVGDLMQKDSKVKEAADRIISGAVEVQTEWAADDGCVVTLEVRRDEVERAMDRDRPYEDPQQRAPSAAVLAELRAAQRMMPGMDPGQRPSHGDAVVRFPTITGAGDDIDALRDQVVDGVERLRAAGMEEGDIDRLLADFKAKYPQYAAIFRKGR